MTNKHLVYIFKSAPYGSPLAQEGLDALLAAAIFEQQVSVLFIDEGVFQLTSQQNPSQQKNQAKMLQALAMYDIDHCFVHTPSVELRNLEADDFCIPVKALDNNEVQSLIASANHALTF